MFTRNSGRAAARVLAAAVVSFCVAVAAGCSKDLSRGRAADLIKSHEDFKATQDTALPVGRFSYVEAAIKDDFVHQALAGAGLLTIRETGNSANVWCRPCGKSPIPRIKKLYWRGTEKWKEYLVELTPAGQAAAGAWVKTSELVTQADLKSPEETVYRIPLSERRLVEVTGIVSDPSGKLAQVEFTWKWAATSLTKLLPKLAPPDDVHTGAADFQLYDDGWRIQAVSFQ